MRYDAGWWRRGDTENIGGDGRKNSIELANTICASTLSV